jgi:hypothetical protein
MKSVLRRMAALIDIDTYQRLLAYAILKQTWPQIKPCPSFQKREELWDYCSDVVVGKSKDIT